MHNPNMQWLNTITNESHNRIAAKLNIAQSTISRLATSTNPNPTTVRDIARMYGADPLLALHEAGFLTDTELEGYRTITPLSRVTSTELLQELLRREHDGNK